MGSLASKLGVAQVDKHGQARPLWAKLLDPTGVFLRETALYTYEQEISVRYSEPIDTDADDTGEDPLDSTPELKAEAETGATGAQKMEMQTQVVA